MCETDAGLERGVLFDVLGRLGIDRHGYMEMLDYAVLRGAKAFEEWTGGSPIDLGRMRMSVLEQLTGSPSSTADAAATNPLQRIGGFLGRYLPKIDLHIR